MSSSNVLLLILSWQSAPTSSFLLVHIDWLIYTRNECLGRVLMLIFIHPFSWISTPKHQELHSSVNLLRQSLLASITHHCPGPSVPKSKLKCSKVSACRSMPYVSLQKMYFVVPEIETKAKIAALQENYAAIYFKFLSSMSCMNAERLAKRRKFVIPSLWHCQRQYQNCST